MIRPHAPLRVVIPEGTNGPASPSTPCQTCGARTADGKPFCEEHVLNMPHVRRLAHVRAAEGEVVEVARRDHAEVSETARRHNGAAKVREKRPPAPPVKAGRDAIGRVFPPRACRACKSMFGPTGPRQIYCKACGAPSKRAIRSRQGRRVPAGPARAAAPAAPTPPPVAAPAAAPPPRPAPVPPPPARVQLQAPERPALELMRGTHDLLAVVARVARAVADELGRMAAESRPR